MLLFIEKKKIYYKNMMKNVLKLDNYIALEKTNMLTNKTYHATSRDVIFHFKLLTNNLHSL